jgi:transposase
MRWYRAWIQRGKRDLAPLRRGRPTLMSERKLVRLEKALLQGPVAYGYTTPIWTLERISEVIAKTTGVHYHPGHVWRLLRRMGWSLQKPTTRARERDEVLIEQWKKRTWVRLKKTP